MKNTANISIVIPAYNAETFISETLESIKEQSFEDWEVIIIDDGSTDSTLSIATDYCASSKGKARLIKHEKNQGLPATRNTGITNARGDWVALLDSDDLWTSDHLETLWRHAEQGNAQLIYSGSLLFEGSIDNVIETRAPSKASLENHPRSLFEADYAIQPSSTLIAKNVLDQTSGFDPTIKYCEDRDMWLRIAETGAGFSFTNRNTCLYRKHGNAMTSKSATMAYYNAMVYQKHIGTSLVSSQLASTLAADAWLSAARLARTDDPQKALLLAKKSIEANFNLKAFLFLIALRLQTLRNPQGG